ncbi:hypothetical protein LN042_23340 [Kitasatospora sp. RB6PN24]|uniref:hypothetical protein n=1 Tax=Kitasatospora humi TaxID=2893891 RepID=UPI001E3A9403|nr:hypothetical protein [Kitasatospora humi]MCC9309972.1 hypothetical protein [Kitasatospora humi]
MESKVRTGQHLPGGPEKTSHAVDMTALVIPTGSPGLIAEGVNGFAMMGTDGRLVVGFDAPPDQAGESATA